MNPIYTITPSVTYFKSTLPRTLRHAKRFRLSALTYSNVTHLSGYNAVIFLQLSDMSQGYRSEVCA